MVLFLPGLSIQLLTVRNMLTWESGDPNPSSVSSRDSFTNWTSFLLAILLSVKWRWGTRTFEKFSSNSTIYYDLCSENFSIHEDLVASSDVYVENFHPSERFGMWPSIVTSSLLLLILSPFPSVHTTCPLFLLDTVHPPAREQVQKTSVFFELSCFCVLPAEIPSGANVLGQLLLWKPSFPFVFSALNLRDGLDRIASWGQTWYIFFLPYGRSLLESKCPAFLSPGTWSWALHWLPAKRSQPALTALTS